MSDIGGACRGCSWSRCPARWHGEVELAPAGDADVNGAQRP
eukprot:COSAG04_NODE_30276_length_263_cov_9.548780_1_plen_40_part_10